MKNTTKNNLIAELEMLGNEIEDKNINYAVMHGGLHNLTIKELREEIECAKNALNGNKKIVKKNPNEKPFDMDFIWKLMK